ncbi:hypothetical protein ASD64_18790 [Mesorhizobium sp. Root157]|uniref:hypothetical protein n=1 Tax=Mesorhizobium sp. Root157 TaxID=1736477 RepID=UPI0007002EEE|nr:hypothetical protein [Mesorhizobium sp. Root157]KQZ95330.1 hypothetical protein ASD64_18790 [Mesorhizobium sp. Root157]
MLRFVLRVGGYLSCPNYVARQKAKRAAVAQTKLQLLISAKRFKTGAEPKYRVLVRGKYHDVGPRALTFLQAGRTPNAIGLTPIDEDE